MRKIYYLFIIALCSIVHLMILSSCSEDDSPPLPIDLESISKVYKGDELRIFLNGEEYSSSGEKVTLALPSMVQGYTESDETSEEEKMLLELLPLWPDVRFFPEISDFKNIVMEVEALYTD